MYFCIANSFVFYVYINSFSASILYHFYEKKTTIFSSQKKHWTQQNQTKTTNRFAENENRDLSEYEIWSFINKSVSESLAWTALKLLIEFRTSFCSCYALCWRTFSFLATQFSLEIIVLFSVAYFLQNDTPN